MATSIFFNEYLAKLTCINKFESSNQLLINDLWKMTICDIMLNEKL